MDLITNQVKADHHDRYYERNGIELQQLLDTTFLNSYIAEV